MKNLGLILAFLFSTQLAFAQYLTQHESENFTEEGQIITSIVKDNYIYYFGRSKDYNEYEHHVIRKLDTLGNEIWSNTDTPNPTSSSALNSGQLQMLQMRIGTDGFLYAFESTSYADRLWKIDTSNGLIIYRTYTAINNSSKAVMAELPGDTLVFSNEMYNNRLGITYRSKTSGSILSTHLVSYNYADGTLTTDNQSSIYIAYNDSLAKYSSTNVSLGNHLWKFKIPYNGSFFLQNIAYDSVDNAVYVFVKITGNINQHRKIFKIDANTGNILWTYNSSQYDYESNFIDFKEDANYLYTLWQSNLFSDRIILNKIDKSTGTELWVISTDMYYSGDQFPTNLQIDNSGIYIGNIAKNIYYPYSLYWGVIKFDYNGNKLFQNIVGDFVNNYSSQTRVYVAGNKLNVMGGVKIPEKNLGKEQFFQFDKTTGTLLFQKDLGGKAILPSQTISVAAFSDGTFAVLQQKGEWGVLSHRSLSGAVLWDTTLSGKATHLEVAQDTMIWVQIEQQFMVINRFNKQVVTGDIFFNNPAIDVFYDAVNNRNMYAFLDDGDITFHNSYQLGNAYTNFGHTDLGGNFDDNTQVMLDYSASEMFVISKYKYSTLDKLTFIENSTTTIPAILQLQYTDFASSNSIVIVGKTINSKVLVVNVNRMTLNMSYSHEIPTLSGSGKKFIAADTYPFIFILSDDGSDISITKFNFNTKVIAWSQVVASSNGIFSTITAKDISYNTLGDYITYTGYRENSTTGEKEMVYGFLKSDGTVISHQTNGGDFTGNNQGSVLTTFANNKTTLIGGSIQKNQGASDAAILYFNETDLKNKINAIIFLDLNNNGAYETSEPKINKGSILIDNNDEYFPDDNGFIRTLATPGWRNVTYQLPANWLLTTDSLTYIINPYSTNYTNDTLYFGINAQFTIPSVEPFLIAQDLVCNLSVPMLLKIKNTGTTIENVRVKLAYDGTFNQASILPSLITNSALSWTLGDIYPGSSETIDLSFVMPGVTGMGDLLNYKATVYLYNAATQTVKDSFEYHYQDILLCAYDPNDKKVTPRGVGEEGLTLFNRYLNYTIRFQNTGNYPAMNIVITDTLDTNLDLSTFEFIAASHDITEVKRNGNIINFVFNNIFLPDSVHNEPGSHGFVSFRIKPINGLPENTDITNTAHIYFDFNPAIVTNTTQNRLVSTIVATNNILSIDDIYTIYPNPTTGILFLQNKNSNRQKSIDWALFDGIGRQIKIGNLPPNENQINFSDLPNGLYILQLNHLQSVKILILK